MSSSLNLDPLTADNWTRWEVCPANPNQMFWFENIDTEFWYWFLSKLWWVFWVITAFYWIGVYSLQKYMKNRPSVTNLAYVMVTYDLVVAAFSIIAFYRLFPVISTSLFSSSGGLHKSLCYRGDITVKEAFWLLAIMFSKIFHFCDTFFDALRKKPIKFTQMYHHSIAAVLLQHVFPLGEPMLIWIGLPNLFQHAVTYPFFALKAMKVKLPKFVSSFIVVVELIQMIIGLGVGLYTRHVTNSGAYCVRHPKSIAIFNFIYFTMLILVVRLAYSHFTSRRSKTKKAD